LKNKLKIARKYAIIYYSMLLLRAVQRWIAALRQDGRDKTGGVLGFPPRGSWHDF
jgi:hypothetical protein